MSDMTARMAQVIAAHREYGNDCQCGWKDTTNLYEQFTGHEQHVAAAIAAELEADYVLVPKTHTIVRWHEGWTGDA